MVRAETERVPKEHYPIVLCALRSALSDTLGDHGTLARSLAPSNVSAARPKGRASRLRIINSPWLLSKVTVLLQCILGG